MTFKLLPYVFIIFLAFQVNFLQYCVVELPVSYYIFDIIGNLHIFFFDLTEWNIIHNSGMSLFGFLNKIWLPWYILKILKLTLSKQSINQSKEDRKI
jgi:hypothetical protein